MILILTPNIDPESNSYQQLMSHLSRLQDIKLRVHREQGTQQTLTEIYLIGNTSAIAVDDMKSLPGVEREVAQSIVDEAHQTCPYSKAVRGNIDVAVNLI